MKFFVILIKFFVLVILLIASQPVTLLAAECDRNNLIVTAPREGARTSNTTVAFRGFTCQNSHIILVHNETTDDSFVADTDELCHGKDCVYRFATFINNLAMGVNKLTATLPGQDPSEAVPIQIIRTALVWNEAGMDPPAIEDVF